MLFIEASMTLAVYIIVFIIAIRIYMRQETKGKWWVIVLVLALGFFSVSLELFLFEQIHNFAIIPLGASLFYLFTRTRRETRVIYRPFVWLGFLANYGFFITGILTIFVTNILFPPGQLPTYAKSFDKATILNTHLSVQNNVQLTTNAFELLNKSVPTEVEAHEWYNDQVYNLRAYKNEKFPYMLQNVTAPVGMNIDVFYYIEQDGQGLLVQTPNRHYYFRTSDTFIEKDGDD